MSVGHPLAAVLADAAAGSFPPADGGTDVLPADHDGTYAVVALTGHAYVLADVDEAELRRRVTDGAGGGFGGAGDPAVLSWVAGPHGQVGTVDVMLVHAGPAVGVAPDGTIEPLDDRHDHHRVARAVAHRRDVHVYGDGHGLVTVGRGLVGRCELSVELFGSAPPGAGRRLIAAGLQYTAPGEPCWAQVAAGNARSLRAFLAAGFVPVGSEVLITPG